MTADLVVRRLDTNTEVHRVAVHNLSEHSVERVMLGMLINMGADYYIDDSEIDEARTKEEEAK